MNLLRNCLDAKDIPGIEKLTSYNSSDIQEAYIGVKNILEKRKWDELTKGRFSWLLIVQLIEKRIRKGSIHFVVNEIEHLEDPNAVKSSFIHSGYFEHPPLNGLQKKHYAIDGWEEFKINILNPIYSPKGQRTLEQTIKKNYKKNKKTSYVLLKTLEDLIFDKYMEKAAKSKLTGEWIVFHTYGGENYYLALLDHEPKENHQKIAYLVKMFCRREFPQFNKSIDLFDFS